MFNLPIEVYYPSHISAVVGFSTASFIYSLLLIGNSLFISGVIEGLCLSMWGSYSFNGADCLT
jgi:hypothetical protein